MFCLAFKIICPLKFPKDEEGVSTVPHPLNEQSAEPSSAFLLLISENWHLSVWISLLVFITLCPHLNWTTIFRFNSENFSSSVQFSHSVVSDSLWPHGLQQARLPCPSLTPRACPNSCPSIQWCHSTISSSVVPFSSCLQSLPASVFFPISQFFTSCGQSIGASTSASVLSMNIQDWLRTPIFWIEPQAQFWQLLQSRSQIINRLELGLLTNTELGKNQINNNPRRTVIWFKLIKCILCAYLWITYCAMNFTYIIHIWISPVTHL